MPTVSGSAPAISSRLSRPSYNSEQELAKLGCAHLHNKDHAQVLVGGLGVGYTLAAALECVSKNSQVTVAELIPEVVEWNQGPRW